MKQFLKQVLAVIVGFVLMFFILGVFIASILTAASTAKSETASIKDKSVLKLNLNYTISEQNKTEDIDFLSGSLAIKEKIGLENTIRSIQKAKNDDKIKGIYLEMGIMPNSFASIDALRRTLLDFKTSGKFIKAYGEYVSQKSYYLASVADDIFVNPEGLVEMRGIGTQLTFYKKFLDKIEAEVQVFKVGTFKSAVEPFIREEMSDANRKQMEFLLGGIKKDFINNISTARNIEAANLEEYINMLAFNTVDTSVTLGLIDGAKYYDEVLDDLAKTLEVEDTKDINFISLNKYASTVVEKTLPGKDKIAVVFAEGEIVSAKAQDALSSEEYAKIITKLSKDEDIKAIVLRVNSPGGSALASEVIWRALEKAKEAKKVVVSMGSLAASGGYYIACNADHIFAEENTITGSIGVFGLVPNFEKFLENKIGVTFDEVSLNDHANMNGVTKQFDEYEKSVIQKGVNKVYDTFTKRVADGRGMTQEEVDKIGQGRVWTGEQAKDLGLVDELGGLQDAIAYTAKLIETEEYDIKEFPREKEAIEQIMEQFGIEQVKERMLKEELGVMYPYYKQTKNLEAGFNTVQAKMPYIIEVK